MPIWSEILREIAPERAGGRAPDFDGVRRKYLSALNRHSGRNTVLYASGWLQQPDAEAHRLSIGDWDIQALMEIIFGLRGDSLDLILHSPGGSAESAEAMVSYLRSKFKHIRVLVPQTAMSAATMLACAADEIVLGAHSFLGPIDTQMIIPTPLGMRVVPAQAILDQFDKAYRECSEDTSKLALWAPTLNQYGPDLLVQCESALDLSRELVQTWLARYMFKDESDGARKARAVAEWLADHQHFKSHNRHIPRHDLQARGMKIVELEEDKALQDLSLSVFHAATHTLAGSSAVKIVENHTGRAFIQNQGQHIGIPIPVPMPPPGWPEENGSTAT